LTPDPDARHPTCFSLEFPFRIGCSLTSGGGQLEHTPPRPELGGLVSDSPEATPVMSRRQPGRTFVRALFCFMPAVLGLAFLSGCDDAYDETTLYPPRTDWLVEAMPKALPTRINPPGVLPLQSLSVTTNFFGPDQDLLRNERN